MQTNISCRSADLQRSFPSEIQGKESIEKSPLKNLPFDLIQTFQNKALIPSPLLIESLYGERSGFEELDVLIKVIAQEPILYREMLAALNLKPNAFYPSFYSTEKEKQDRLRILPLVYGARIRSIFLNFINTSLRLHSENLHKNLDIKNHWEVVVIGAGFHGSLFVNRLKAERPNANVLIIDKEDLPSQHFTVGGHYFNLNNTLNEPDEGPSFQREEKYNLPHTYGPVQVTDLTGERWPIAKLIAEVGRITLFNSQCDCLLRTPIIAVSKLRDLYLLKTAEGKIISTKKVIFATGLGQPRIPCQEEESKAILEKAILHSDAILNDKIMTVEQAFAKTPRNDPLSFWKTENDLDLILVGFGNSALTFIEFLYGMGPSTAYEYGNRQSLKPMKIAIIMGNSVVSVDPKDIQKHLRPRYSGIMSPIKEGQANPLLGALTKVRHLPNGQIEAIYSVNGEEKSLSASRLILATGYDIQVVKLLNFIATKDDFKLLRGFVANSTIPLPFSKKLENEEIYCTGPAAGRDLVDINHNTNGVPLVEIGQAEAIPYTSVLTEHCAKEIAQSLQEVAEDVTISHKIIKGSTGKEEYKTPLIFPEEKQAMVDNFIAETTNEMVDTDIKVQFLQFFCQIEFKEISEVSLKFVWKKNHLMVESDSLESYDLEWLSSEIRKNRSLLLRLSGYAVQDSILSLSIKIDTTKNRRDQLMIDSFKLHRTDIQFDIAYVNTNNPNKRLELENIYHAKNTKLIFGSTEPKNPQHVGMERAIAKAKIAQEGILVEENTLTVGNIEVQSNEALIQQFIGKEAAWDCYLCKKNKGEIFIFLASVHGLLVDKRGEGGFGFDSYFQPLGSDKTLAEEKSNQHNARALAIELLTNNEIFKTISIGDI